MLATCCAAFGGNAKQSPVGPRKLYNPCAAFGEVLASPLRRPSSSCSSSVHMLARMLNMGSAKGPWLRHPCSCCFLCFCMPARYTSKTTILVGTPILSAQQRLEGGKPTAGAQHSPGAGAVPGRSAFWRHAEIRHCWPLLRIGTKDVARMPVVRQGQAKHTTQIVRRT